MVTTRDHGLHEKMRLLMGQGMDTRAALLVPDRRLQLPHDQHPGGHRAGANGTGGIAPGPAPRRRRVVPANTSRRLPNSSICPSRSPGRATPTGCSPSCCRTPPASAATNSCAPCSKNGIETRPVFYPLHVMPPYYEPGARCPVAEDLACPRHQPAHPRTAHRRRRRLYRRRHHADLRRRPRALRRPIHESRHRQHRPPVHSGRRQPHRGLALGDASPAAATRSKVFKFPSPNFDSGDARPDARPAPLRPLAPRRPPHRHPHSRLSAAGIPNKVLWFIHHMRGAYDLWGTRYQEIPDTPGGPPLPQGHIQRRQRGAFARRERSTPTRSVVSARLKRFNGRRFGSRCILRCSIPSVTMRHRTAITSCTSAAWSRTSASTSPWKPCATPARPFAWCWPGRVPAEGTSRDSGRYRRPARRRGPRSISDRAGFRTIVKIESVRALSRRRLRSVR